MAPVIVKLAFVGGDKANFKRVDAPRIDRNLEVVTFNIEGGGSVTIPLRNVLFWMDGGADFEMVRG